MRTPILAANWKMYKTLAEAEAFARELLAGLGDVRGREVVLCAPYTALDRLRGALAGSPVALAAQDVFYEDQGAYTGAISPLMLTDVGCAYTIIGHSERRQYFGDTDAIVNRKIHAALKHGLKVILAIGESKPQRDAGQAEAVVVAQVRAALAGVSVARWRNWCWRMSRSGRLARVIRRLRRMPSRCTRRSAPRWLSCMGKRRRMRCGFSMVAA